MSDWDQVPESINDYAIKFQSTYADIKSWMSHFRSRRQPSDPICGLFEVVRIDTLNLVVLLDSILREINDNSCSEEKLRQHIDEWRRLLNIAQDELPRLSQSVREFFETARPVLKLEIDVLHQQLSDLSERVGLARGVIHAEMALINSRKGIIEAESVKNLTELAFFFIPMAFSAALFSIQVREFDKHPPPVWAFVATAATAVALAYIARTGLYLWAARKRCPPVLSSR